MAWSYKPLWRLLVECEMTKTAMQKKAGITSAALAKMGKNQPVTMDSLGKICQTLHCRLDDIVEYIPE